MTGLSTVLILMATLAVLLYHRMRLILSTLIFAAVLVTVTILHGVTIGLILCWLVFIPVAGFLNFIPWRRKYFSNRVLTVFQNEMPGMSKTETEAIAAGTVTWEGDLFRGNPDWNKLLALPPATLTTEEQAFIDGPVETLCSMISDWDITHNRADLPPEMWAFLKEQGFFALIITKEYGGKEFSAYAHSQILTKVYSKSGSVASTIAVPNSLGPAELLMHYGTAEQKNYYLPRLARGDR